MITVKLPWPPSANRYWRFYENRVLTSREALVYKFKVRSLPELLRPQRMDGRLSAEIIAFPPDKRKRDLDNLLKITLDSMEAAGVFNNDSQLDRIVIERGSLVKNGSLLVTISPYEAK